MTFFDTVRVHPVNERHRLAMSAMRPWLSMQRCRSPAVKAFGQRPKALTASENRYILLP